MKTINVTIEGVTPLLMNSPKAMLTASASTRSTLQKPDPKKEAEDKAYRTSKGMLYIPATAVFSAMINGSSFKKAGKYALKPILSGNVRVEPDEIPLGTKNYEIDIRTAVISQGRKKNRIIRARPRIDEWKANFKIVFNENAIADADIIKGCLSDAGYRVGLLDFAPRNNGSFGTFKVTKFEVE
jgi:hypothetical protein